MSMEISGNYKDYKNEYLERAQTEQDKVKRISQEQRAEDKSEGVPIPKDEYISSEKSVSKPSGLYLSDLTAPRSEPAFSPIP